LRFRVEPGQVVDRHGDVYVEGEEFDATGDEAQQWQRDERVSRVDKPTK
jgi:hypothetical protein